MARARKPSWRDIFLAALRGKGNVSEACATAGISRSLAYETRKDDEAFASAWDDALAEAADALEAEAWRRAYEGVDEPVYGRVGKDQDGQIGTVRKYSDTLMSLLLKAHKPEKFRERYDVKQSGANLNIDWTQVPADLRDAFIERTMSLDDVLRELQRRNNGA